MLSHYLHYFPPSSPRVGAEGGQSDSEGASDTLRPTTSTQRKGENDWREKGFSDTRSAVLFIPQRNCRTGLAHAQSWPYSC
jgi:hypothetical protein